MVGAGHAHLTILKHLQSFTALTHNVSVISSNAYHYYSGMAAGMLAGIYKPQEIRFNVRKMVEDRNAKFIEDSVSRVNPETKKIYLNSGATVDYDIVSFNTGSIVPSGPINPSDDSVIKVKPIENLVQARKTIMERLKKGALKITVAGGGPTGVEIAANIRRRRLCLFCTAESAENRNLCRSAKFGIISQSSRDIERRNVSKIRSAKIVYADF